MNNEENNELLSCSQNIISRLFFWKERGKGACQHRVVVPNFAVSAPVSSRSHPNHSFCSNRIRTAKYTLLSLIPKNLLEQFHRIANIYFILIVLLNFIPEINAFGKEVNVIPVTFVLLVTLIKDSFEDYSRHKADKRVNNATCRVHSWEGENKSNGRYVKRRWSEVRVGDLVHLSVNEPIPADIVFLRSSDPLGLCYLETSSLDGESSLKQRQVPHFLHHNEEITSTNFYLECDFPNNKIYNFNGCIVRGNERIPLNKDHLLLRDCLIKNADFVEGIVVYAGHDTKTMLNNRGPRYKRSKLESYMNRDVIWCIVLLVIICFGGALGTMLWEVNLEGSELIPYYKQHAESLARSGFISLLSYIIIFQVMIPLSLYVTIELIKLGQIYFLEHDRELYDPRTGDGIKCRALNIPEELGQVEVVFSDKTGTLTENHMIFRSCSIRGIDFSHNQSASTANAAAAVMANLKAGPNGHKNITDTFIPDQKLEEMLSSKEGFSAFQEFFILLALCNTVVVSKHPHKDQMNASGLVLDQLVAATPDCIRSPHLQSITASSASQINSKTSTPSTSCANAFLSIPVSPSPMPSRSSSLLKKPIYEAESPDEIALVEAAFNYNFCLLERTPFHATLAIPGIGRVKYKICQVLPFDPIRKRMSIIVEHPETHQKTIYTKGADSAIFSILEMADSEEKKEVRSRTQYHLNDYSRRGLRILSMAKKDLKDEDYEAWARNHREIEALVGEAASEGRKEELLQNSFATMESKLELLGATGIEDQLQDGVRDTIAALRGANIVVWVLTGDKQETAVNVAFSCHLFSQEMELITINARSKSTAADCLQFYLKEVLQNPGQKRALVIDGKTLMYFLDLEEDFVVLVRHCSAVLCCRATPLQKASIVKLVKGRMKVMTLAIGDGANDVSMLQTADVGIGISGQEGLQAVMASDFAIARFHHLKRLLLVHGHWNYDRLTRVILYFFYKNSSVIFTIFWYQIFCSFSGAVMIDQLYLMLINVFFTSLPPMALGILDQDCSAKLLMHNPYLYTQGQGSKLYSKLLFWLNMADSFYQSLVMFFLPFGVSYDSTDGIWEFGTMICTIFIFVHLLVFLIEAKSVTWLHLFSVFLSLGVYFGVALVYNAISVGYTFLQNPYMVMQHSLRDPRFWFLLLLTSVLAVLPRIVYKCLQGTLCPSHVQYVLSQSCHSPSTMSTVSWSRWSSHSSIDVSTVAIT